MMKRTAVTTPSCAFCAGIGKPYTPHWQFSKPVDGVLTCPVLLAYTCRLCNGKGHIEKRCTKQQAVQKPRELFCRFCCNAKKPDYQSHNQFDKDGFVKCPVLLAIECQLCGEKGHTKGYCTNVHAKQVQVQAQAQAPVTKPACKNLKKNKFACLEVIEETDECDARMLPKPTAQESACKSTSNSWAGRVAMPQPVKVSAVQVPVVQVPAVQVPTVVQVPVAEDVDDETTTFVFVPSKSWADYE